MTSSLGWSTRVTIVNHSQIWFTEVDSHGSYCIPQLTLVRWVDQPGLLLYTTVDSGSLGVDSQVSYYIPQLTLAHWGGQLGFLMYTPANSGFFGWSARVPFVYPNLLWFIGVVSQGSYCILKLTSSLGWSTRVTIVYHSQIWFIGVDSQGSYCIPQLTLVRWGDHPGFILYTPADSGSLGWSARAPIVYPS